MVKIQKWGNSNGIKIPSSILKQLDLKINDKVDLTQEEDKIIISKSKKNHKTIEERFEMFNKLPNQEKGRVETYNWKEDLGKEKFE